MYPFHPMFPITGLGTEEDSEALLEREAMSISLSTNLRHIMLFDCSAICDDLIVAFILHASKTFRFLFFQHTRSPQSFVGVKLSLNRVACIIDNLVVPAPHIIPSTHSKILANDPAERSAVVAPVSAKGLDRKSVV